MFASRSYSSSISSGLTMVACQCQPLRNHAKIIEPPIQKNQVQHSIASKKSPEQWISKISNLQYCDSLQKKRGYSRICKTQLQPIKNAAKGYNCIFIAAFANTAYVARLQPPAGTQSCVFKNAAQTGVYSCVFYSLESRFLTTPDARPIATFSIETRLQVAHRAAFKMQPKQCFQLRFRQPRAAFFTTPEAGSIATFSIETCLQVAHRAAFVTQPKQCL